MARKPKDKLATCRRVISGGHVQPAARHDDPGWPRLLARRLSPDERQVLAPQAARAA